MYRRGEQNKHNFSFNFSSKATWTIRTKESFRLIRRAKLIFLPYRKESNHHFSNLKGGMCQAKFWHEGLGPLNFRDVANTADEVS